LLALELIIAVLKPGLPVRGIGDDLGDIGGWEVADERGPTVAQIEYIELARRSSAGAAVKKIVAVFTVAHVGVDGVTACVRVSVGFTEGGGTGGQIVHVRPAAVAPVDVEREGLVGGTSDRSGQRRLAALAHRGADIDVT